MLATVRLRRVSGEARGRVGCRVGGTGGQRLDGLGCQAGFGWVAETRETDKGPAPGHRLARDPPGTPRTLPSERAMNRWLLRQEAQNALNLRGVHVQAGLGPNQVIRALDLRLHEPL